MSKYALATWCVELLLMNDLDWDISLRSSNMFQFCIRVSKKLLSYKKAANHIPWSLKIFSYVRALCIASRTPWKTLNTRHNKKILETTIQLYTRYKCFLFWGSKVFLFLKSFMNCEICFRYSIFYVSWNKI